MGGKKKIIFLLNGLIRVNLSTDLTGHFSIVMTTMCTLNNAATGQLCNRLLNMVTLVHRGLNLKHHSISDVLCM